MQKKNNENNDNIQRNKKIIKRKFHYGNQQLLKTIEIWGGGEKGGTGLLRTKKKVIMVQ